MKDLFIFLYVFEGFLSVAARCPFWNSHATQRSAAKTQLDELWSENAFNVPPAGTVAEGAPIIPISAQLKYNIEVVCEYIVKMIPVPVRDFTSEPRLIGKTSKNTNIDSFM